MSIHSILDLQVSMCKVNANEHFNNFNVTQCLMVNSICFITHPLVGRISTVQWNLTYPNLTYLAALIIRHTILRDLMRFIGIFGLH